LVLLAAMLAALLLLVVVKGLRLMWRRLLPASKVSAENTDNDRDVSNH